MERNLEGSDLGNEPVISRDKLILKIVSIVIEQVDAKYSTLQFSMVQDFHIFLAKTKTFQMHLMQMFHAQE